MFYNWTKNISSKINSEFLVKLSTAVAYLIGTQIMMQWLENIMQDFLLKHED